MKIWLISFFLFLFFAAAATAFGDEGRPPADSGEAGEDEAVIEGVDAMRVAVRLAIQAMTDENYERARGILETVVSSSLFPLMTVEDQVATIYALGQACNAVGEHREAVRQYRRILVAFPGLVRVRLELARSLFMLRDDSTAEYHFRLALAGDLPEAVEANIRRYLREIRQRRRWTFDLSGSVQHNTNVNVAPTIRHIEGKHPFDPGTVQWTLPDEARAQSGIGVSVQAFGEFRETLNPRTLVRMGGFVDHTHYSNSRFNHSVIGGHIGPHFLFEGGILGDSTTSFLAQAYRQWVGGHQFNEGMGPVFEYTAEPTDRLRLNARAEHAWVNYHTATHLDGSQSSLTLRPALVLTPTSVGLLTLGVGYERTGDERYRNWQYRFGLGYIRDFPFGVTVGLHPEYRYLQYREDDPFFGVRRRDHFFNGRADLLNRRVELFGFTPVLSYRYQYRDSSIDVYDFDQHRIEFSLTRRF